jgi:hypothetical protein
MRPDDGVLVMEKRFEEGDRIEIRYPTHDGYIWNPGTVAFAGDRFLGVDLPDGARKVVALRRQDEYRRPIKKGASDAR